MSEYKRPVNEAEYHENFAQIHPLMNPTEAHYESARCLFCYDAPCVTACPTGIDIPLFIRQISSGNITGSAKTIYEANTFGRACGYVCPTAVLCEGACVYNDQDVKPIEIGRLQAFATDNAIKADKTLFAKSADNGKKVAIIGAGPAGIACACELRKSGFSVDVYEAKAHPSGLTVYGVAPYKITNQVVLEEMAYLENKFGYKTHYNFPIQSKADFAKLEADYDAIFLGIGLGSTRKLDLPGEDLENCYGAVEFIEKLKIEQHQTVVGKHVIVIGGGNTAMDAASEAARMGAEKVTLCYRRFHSDMPAYPFEHDLVKSVGVTSVFNVVPVGVFGDTAVESVQFSKSEVKDGKVSIIPQSDFNISCDMLIKATGQTKQTDLFSQIDKLSLDTKNCIMVDPQTGQTSNPKYFAGGDAVNGGKEVVNAVSEGKKAAAGIAGFLLGEL